MAHSKQSVVFSWAWCGIVHKRLRRHWRVPSKSIRAFLDVSEGFGIR